MTDQTVQAPAADVDVDQYGPPAPPTSAERPKRQTGEARARRSDPETSHAAAASVESLNVKQRAVYDVLAEGEATDEQLLDRYALAAMAAESQDGDTLPAQSQSGIRTRRSELVDAGLVVDSGRREKTRAGRATIVWAIAS